MAKGEKFVILHGAVGPWTQGQVIDRDDLKAHDKDGKETADYHDRLIELGAIRPASAEEVGQTKVDVSGVPLALSPLAQAELAARDARIEQLKAHSADLQARVNQAAAAQTVAQALVPAMSEAERAAFERQAKDKDAQIELLSKRIEGLEKQAAEQQKAAQKAEAAAEKKASPPPVPPTRK